MMPRVPLDLLMMLAAIPVGACAICALAVRCCVIRERAKSRRVNGVAR
jgi:hypothetical protein